MPDFMSSAKCMWRRAFEPYQFATSLVDEFKTASSELKDCDKELKDCVNQIKDCATLTDFIATDLLVVEGVNEPVFRVDDLNGSLDASVIHGEDDRAADDVDEVDVQDN